MNSFKLVLNDVSQMSRKQTNNQIPCRKINIVGLLNMLRQSNTISFNQEFDFLTFNSSFFVFSHLCFFVFGPFHDYIQSNLLSQEQQNLEHFNSSTCFPLSKTAFPIQLITNNSTIFSLNTFKTISSL